MASQSPFWCWCSSRSEASWGAALQAAFVTSGLSAAEQIWPLSAWAASGWQWGEAAHSPSLPSKVMFYFNQWAIVSCMSSNESILQHGGRRSLATLHLMSYILTNYFTISLILFLCWIVISYYVSLFLIICINDICYKCTTKIKSWFEFRWKNQDFHLVVKSQLFLTL